MKKLFITFFCYLSIFRNLNAENISPDKESINKIFTIEKDLSISSMDEDIPVYHDDLVSFFYEEYNSDFKFKDLEFEVDILNLEYKAKEIFFKRNHHKAYAKAGYSTEPSPLLEAGYANTYKEKLSYYGLLKHSSNGKNFNHYHEYKNKIDLGARYYFEKFLIGANIDSGFYKVSTPIVDTENYEVTLPKTFEASVYAKNFFEKKFFFNPKITYSHAYLTDYCNENFLKLSSGFIYKISAKNTLKINSAAGLSNYKTKNFNENIYSLFLRGENELSLNKWSFFYGVGLPLTTNKSREENFNDPFICFPILKIKYKFLYGDLTYALTDIKCNINSMKNLLEEYKYISPENFKPFESKEIVVSGISVEGSFWDNFKHKESVNPMIFSLNDENFKVHKQKNKPSYIFFSNNIIGLSFQSELMYKNLDMTKVFKTTFNYTFFKNELTDEGPWLNFSAQWSQRFKEKIFLTSSFKYNFLKFSERIKEEKIDSEIVTRKYHFLDFSISTDYLINSDWSAFVAVDNIFMQRSIKSHPLEKPGIKISGGIRYMFL